MLVGSYRHSVSDTFDERFPILTDSSLILLRPTKYFPGLSVHADDFTFLDKKGNAYRKACLQSSLLGCSTSCRIAPQSKLSRGDGEINKLRQLKRDRDPVMLQNFQRKALFKVPSIIRHRFNRECELLVSGLVHKVKAVNVTVKK